MNQPTVDALHRLWAETTARPLWLPPHLLRYMRVSRSFDLSEVKRSAVTVTVPKGALPQCRACTNLCCIGKENTVSLRLIDIAALIDLGRTDLIDTNKPDLLDTAPSAARQRFAASRTFAVFPVLKQDAAARCLALTVDNRCSLHPSWPLSCARFPYSLDRDDGEVFYSSRCGSAALEQGTEAEARASVMIDATLNAYNHRVRDFVLLEYQRPALDGLGLTRYLSLT